MKEFIEKLIGRLGEQQAEAENEMHRLRSGDYTLPCSYDITDIKEIASESFKESIQIVNELAEEYKGDWISCSERLPEEKGNYLVTCDDGTICIWWFVVDCNIKQWSMRLTTHKPIAWQPLPTPYKEGE